MNSVNEVSESTGHDEVPRAGSGSGSSSVEAPQQMPQAPDEQHADSGEHAAHRLFHLASQHQEAIVAAQQAVRAGQCIVLPTDTVYGIGADAFNADAVKRLLEAKHRGRDMPPPVLIAEPAMLPALAADVPDNAKKMIERYWPGALTLILRAPASLRMDLGDTEGTIAVRVPADDAARELLRHTGPLAVSSANISGSAPATNAADAEQMLGNSVAIYLDGDPTPGPVASTIVDFTKNRTGRILRQGVIAFEDLAELSPGLEPLANPVSDASAEPTAVPDGQPAVEQTTAEQADAGVEAAAAEQGGSPALEETAKDIDPAAQEEHDKPKTPEA